jgi:transcriptional regulator with XRE-family HTH domain
MTVGESIKSLRAAAGLMQRDLAKRVGISASMLSLVEADKREPSLGVLRSIGRALEVPTSVLFAVALADEDVGRGTKMAQQVRHLTDNIFEAARLSLILRHNLRDKSKPRRSLGRKSA